MKFSFIVIASEIALALYPILIKTVQTDITTQILSRLLTFTVLAFALGSNSDIQKTWGSLEAVKRSSVLGAITLFHIATSYYAFKVLPAGIAMSLFYTYPFFNLLGGVLGFGESITMTQVLLMIVAFIGVVILSPEIREEFVGTDENGEMKFHWKGIATGLLAALSETIMYFAVRTETFPNPFYSTLELYPAALPILLTIMGVTGTSVDTRASVWIPMLLFNSIIGFVGYSLRFWAIPHLKTIIFSLLSFIGVVASFIFGFYFVNEVPSWKSILGATLITGAVGLSGAPS